MGNLITAFSVEQTVNLTGVSKTQLRYWAEQGFFTPGEHEVLKGRQYGRIYTFKDLVSLKILNDLRNKAKVPLGQLRELKTKWNEMGDEVWTSQKLSAANGRVIVDSPGGAEDALSGQKVIEVSIKAECDEMKDKVTRLFRRDASTVGQISRKRRVASNKPTISGTRIPVKTIQAYASRGYSVEEILKEYPALRKEDVLAAIEYRETA